jgi:hypothetical protein
MILLVILRRCRYLDYIMTHMPIARQRLCKQIPKHKRSTIKGHQLLGNGPMNIHS